MAKQEKHEVLADFQDKQDGNFLYKKDDLYPREGGKTTKKRLEELRKPHKKAPEGFISKEPVKDEESETADKE